MIQRIQSIYLLLAGLVTAVPFAAGARGAAVLAVCALLGLLAFAGIFLYRNRKAQMALCRLGVAAALALYLLHFYPEPDGTAHWTLAAPAAYQALTLLALGGIRHDERLVRAADRIR